MESKEHWEQVYSTKAVTGVSWYQEHPERSLRLIEATGLPKSVSIIDVGGGASTLVDDLLNAGYQDVSVLDLSRAALAAAEVRLGSKASHVRWLEADITKVELPERAYDIWHDRAVFHFLTGEEDRRLYVAQVLRSLKPGGHVIVATFAEDGPTQCSGLPVVRYSPAELHAQFGSRFVLSRQEREEHHTPFATTQKFIYCDFMLNDG
jgi:ubiquinone/menaquinone biosynthesis C-methylase UbiE